MKRNFNFVLVIIALLVSTFFILDNIQKNNPEIIPRIDGAKQNQTTHIEEDVVIEEEFFEARYPFIRGDSTIARKSRAYITKLIAEVQKDAEEQVPIIRKDFPGSFEDVRYAVFVEAEYYTSKNTQTIVLYNYVYTGGANGNAFVVSYTQDSQGRILELSSFVPQKLHTKLVQAVQQQFLSSMTETEDENSVLDGEAIQNIRFEQLNRFAIDGQDLLVFFDKYELAAGVVGILTVRISDYQNLKESTDEKIFSIDTPTCFSWHETSHGITTQENLVMTLHQDNTVSAIKSGTIRSESYNSSYSGEFSGTLHNGYISGIYGYSVDGGEHQREERYRIENNQLIFEHYELTEDFDKQILLINPENKIREYTYQQVVCE